MKESKINFTIKLDKDNIPEQIFWEATDKPEESISETTAVSISLWDQLQKNTMRIDLWNKEMPVNEMKRFLIDCIGGLGQSALSATGDEFFAQEVDALCEKLVSHVQEQEKE